MNQSAFADLEAVLTSAGPEAALQSLCGHLEQNKDYTKLFYALLALGRQQMGVCPIPTGQGADLSLEQRAEYEEVIGRSARRVAELLLCQKDIAGAWHYLRMLGEPEPVKRALDSYEPADTEELQRIIAIAFHEGVHPCKGFDLIVAHLGICNGITTLSNCQAGLSADVREHCVRRLVRALHEELRTRLASEIASREGIAPGSRSVVELLQRRSWLFENDAYHVDLSHLASVVQMAVDLPSGEELRLARELCDYGSRLAPGLRISSEPPFEDPYRDCETYLAAAAGDNVEGGIAHFEEKARTAALESGATRAAEALVNLFLRLDRPAEALGIWRRYLTAADARYLTCPGLVELCRCANNYGALAEIARGQDDPVHFLAGLIAARATSSQQAPPDVASRGT